MRNGQQDISFHKGSQKDGTNKKILQKLYENEIQLSKEIRKKKILLQENMEKAVKTLRKVQVRTAFWDTVEDQQRNTWKPENYLCYTKKGNCDREKATREETEKDYNARNAQSTKKTVEKECEHTKKTTTKIEQTKNKTRKEKVVKWQENEIREWDQKTEDNEMVSVCDGEKKRHKQADMQITRSPSSLRLPTLNSSQHQTRDTVPKEMLETNDPEPLPYDGPSSQNTESLQQVQPIPENSSDLGYQLFPCKICNRKFKEDRLEKHISICQKTQKPKCKVYDSSQHRIKGTDLEEFIKKHGPSKTPEKKRQARVPADRNLKTKEDPYSDYVTCPHCSRRFAPGSAETHIPKCQNIKSRPPPPRKRHQK